MLEDEYSCLGIFCAIAFFPLGLLCCLAMKQRVCPNCGAVFGWTCTTYQWLLEWQYCTYCGKARLQSDLLCIYCITLLKADHQTKSHCIQLFCVDLRYKDTEIGVFSNFCFQRQEQGSANFSIRGLFGTSLWTISGHIQQKLNLWKNKLILYKNKTRYITYTTVIFGTQRN